MCFFQLSTLLLVVLCLQFLGAGAVKYVIVPERDKNMGEYSETAVSSRFNKLLIKGHDGVHYLAKSQIAKVNPLRTAILTKTGQEIVFESPARELIKEVYELVNSLLDDLDEDILELESPAKEGSNLGVRNKDQLIATSSPLQVSTGLDQDDCYNDKKLHIGFESGSSFIPVSFMVDKQKGQRLQLGYMEFYQMKSRADFLSIYGSVQKSQSPRLTILWPQDKKTAAFLKLDNFVFEAPERRPMFHVLYSGNFQEEPEELLAKGHSSKSLLAPFIHIYTFLRATRSESTTNCHFSSATYDDGYSSVRLGPQDFDRNSATLKTLLAEAEEGKRLTVLESKPHYRATEEAGVYQYHEPSEGYSTFIVFGSGFDVDLQVGVRSVRRKRDELLCLMVKEYKHAILTALTAESKVQAIYLQPLVDPNDRALFKLSLAALGAAITELSKPFKLIPIKLMLPLLAPRAFHANYARELIEALEEHLSPHSVIVVDKISFSEEKKLFTTVSTKSSPRQKGRSLK